MLHVLVTEMKEYDTDVNVDYTVFSETTWISLIEDNMQIILLTAFQTVHHVLSIIQVKRMNKKV